MSNVIFAGGAGRIKQAIEGLALSAFKPGQLLSRAVAGFDVNTSAATTFGNEFLIADVQPSTVGGGINTAVKVGDSTEAIAVNSGDLVYLSFATGQNVTKAGMAVSSNADGDFKLALTDGTEQVFAVTEQVINVTAAGTLVLCRAI